jgi:predicted flap endonuclease-1-like 5' DNA nuclease
MNLDGTTLLVIGGALVALLILLLILARRGRAAGAGNGQQVRHDAGKAVAPAAAEGRAIADEGAAAARDVAGDILGVERELRIPPADGPADNLQTLKGVGPKLAKQLNEAGVTRFDQLAGLSSAELSLLDSKMGAFRGRLERDRVVEQAAFLARGDRDGYEAIFGKLGSGA